MRIVVAVTLVVIAAIGAQAAEPVPLPDKPADTRARESMQRGLDWMASAQREDGSWSDANYPALTALGMWAFARSDHPKRAEVCDKAAVFIAGFVQEDGGIYKTPTGGRGSGGLSTYNTAICMMALHAYNREKYSAVILKAREFMKDSQLVGDSPAAGGFGYDKDSSGKRADLSNTAWSLQAMRETMAFEDLRPAGKKVDVNWTAAMEYVHKLQNQDSEDKDNFGGFGYEAGGDRGGTTVDKKGSVKLAGYGSMTYAGLEAMIFAEVDRTDPRVRSALDWASRHWSVAENPGMGKKGLYYYYNIMGKALSLVGSDTLNKPTGEQIRWKDDLVTQLAAGQRADGSWANTDNQFWENDPALVTAYSVLTLEHCLGK